MPFCLDVIVGFTFSPVLFTDHFDRTVPIRIKFDIAWNIESKLGKALTVSFTCSPNFQLIFGGVCVQIDLKGRRRSLLP